jgi:hypothetical protein
LAGAIMGPVAAGTRRVPDEDCGLEVGQRTYPLVCVPERQCFARIHGVMIRRTA